jgi:hypothetical protein
MNLQSELRRMRPVTGRAGLGTSVVGKVDGLERGWLCSRREMTHGADGARIRANRRDGRVHRMTGEWTVATFTTDAGVRVGLAKVGDVAVTIDACRLTGIHNRPGLVRGKRTSPVRSKPAVIARNKRRSESQKECDSDGKQCRETKQMLVGAKRRHEVFFRGRTLRNYGAARNLPGFERYEPEILKVCELFSSAVENPAGYFFFLKLLT